MSVTLSTTTKELLKIVDEQKLLILKVLYTCSEADNLCGSDLCEKFDIPKNLLSYHIKLLISANLIGEKKVGRKKYYFVQKNKKLQVKRLLEALNII